MATFQENLDALPGATTGETTGLTPVLVRIAHHLGYLTAHIADKPTDRTTDEAEILDILVHRDGIPVQTPTLSTALRNHIARLRDLLGTINEGWSQLTDEARIERLTQVSHRVAALAYQIDVEMAGIRSAPGNRP